MRRCNPRLAQFRQRKAALLPQIRQLAEHGLSCRQIAARLGLSKTTVHHWLQRLPPEPEAADGQDAGERLTEKLARRSPRRYDGIYVRAIRAWDRTQSDKEIRIVEEAAETDAKGGEKKKQRRATRTETHAANASLLTKAVEALKAIDRLRQAAARRPAGGAGDVRSIPISSLSIDDFHSLSNAQLDALEARLLEKYGQERDTGK